MCTHLDGYIAYDANDVLNFLDAPDESRGTDQMDRFYDCSGWPVELFRMCDCPDRPTHRDDTVYVPISDAQARKWAVARL